MIILGAMAAKGIASALFAATATTAAATTAAAARTAARKVVEDSVKDQIFSSLISAAKKETTDPSRLKQTVEVVTAVAEISKSAHTVVKSVNGIKKELTPGKSPTLANEPKEPAPVEEKTYTFTESQLREFAERYNQEQMAERSITSSIVRYLPIDN